MGNNAAAMVQIAEFAAKLVKSKVNCSLMVFALTHFFLIHLAGASRQSEYKMNEKINVKKRKADDNWRQYHRKRYLVSELVFDKYSHI